MPSNCFCSEEICVLYFEILPPFVLIDQVDVFLRNRKRHLEGLRWIGVDTFFASNSEG
jgi:hypothetical protein